MKRIFILSLTLAAVAITGCNKENIAPEISGKTVTISASMNDTKVSSNAKGRFTWQNNDKIGIWTGSELTAFTLNTGFGGLGYGEFSATLPEGGAINEASVAVYPATATYDAETKEITFPTIPAGWGSTTTYGDGTFYPTKGIYLYSTAPGEAADGKAARFQFNHACAYAYLTIKNVPASAKAAYLECYPGQIWLSSAKVSLAGDEPVLTTEGADWAFMGLPEHSTAIESLTLVLPIRPGEWGDHVKFRIHFTTAAAFGNELDGYGYIGYLDMSDVKAGDYFSLPAITCESERVPDDSGSGVNEGIEDSIVNIEADNFWK